MVKIQQQEYQYDYKQYKYDELQKSLPKPTKRSLKQKPINILKKPKVTKIGII